MLSVYDITDGQNLVERVWEANIIGTSNVVLACMKYNIKLVYISTDYVYPGTDGDYNEDDALSPFMGKSDGVTKYGWSKLGGEAAVHLYKNSLILRICMTEKPFVHKAAFVNVKNNFIFQEDVADILMKLLDKKGVINIGGKTQYIYDFAKKHNKKIKKIYKKKNSDMGVPFDSSMNILKLKKILNTKA